MKKLALFLMIVMIHHGAYALDILDNALSYFKNDPKYTIDKRKYVSNSIEPFSAVVGLKSQIGKNWCSGTLTADGIVVTAKHCIFDGYTNAYKDLNSIIINYQNTNIGVKQRTSSGANIYPDGNYNDTYDWALLVPNKDIKSRIKVSKLTQGATSDVIVVGYGGLKILSNQEIRNIRKEYAKWLNRGVEADMAPYSGVDLNGRSTFGMQFIQDIRNGRVKGIPANTFDDTHRLKASYCRATISNDRYNEIGCQMWGGNSGGSVFYKYNNQWYLYGTTVSASVMITNNRNTYARGAHMVPINTFIKSYRELVSKLKGAKQ